MATKTPRINSREKLADALQQMSALKAQIDQIKATADAKIAALETKKQAEVLPLWEQYRTLEQAASDYALANESTLLEGQKGKALTLVGGTVKYSVGRPSVELDAPLEVLLPRLRQLGLSRFIRITESVDKVAIQREADAIEGVEGIRIVVPATVVTLVPNFVAQAA